jgi:hypothetical protein
LAYEKPQSGLRPFVWFFSGTFLRLMETYGFLYRNRKNVIYSWNVKRAYYRMRQMVSDKYRNRRKRFCLRFNLIAALYNLNLVS